MQLRFPMYSTPYTFSFTGSQVVIPVGARAFDVSVVSGSAYIGGSLYLAGQGLRWTAPDREVILGSPGLAVGTTGATNRVTVFYST